MNELKFKNTNRAKTTTLSHVSIEQSSSAERQVESIESRIRISEAALAKRVRRKIPKTPWSNRSCDKQLLIILFIRSVDKMSSAKNSKEGKIIEIPIDNEPSRFLYARNRFALVEGNKSSDWVQSYSSDMKYLRFTSLELVHAVKFMNTFVSCGPENKTKWGRN